MQRTLVRGFIIVLFVCLIAVPVLYKRVVSLHQAGAASQGERTALAEYGFRLRECAKASGVNFKHAAPTLDPKLAHIIEQVASMGVAVSVVDFDRDGWDDFYFTSSNEHSHNALYRNMHDGTFKDVAERLDWPISTLLRPESRWAPPGVTTTMMATRMS